MTALNDAERAAIHRDAEGSEKRSQGKASGKALPARVPGVGETAGGRGGDGARIGRSPAWLPSRRFIAAVIAIGGMQLLATMDSTIAIVALPRIQDELSLSDAGRSWVITAYVLTFGGLMLLGAASATPSAASGPSSSASLCSPSPRCCAASPGTRPPW